MEKKEKKIKRTDNIIPDYDHIFAEEVVRGNKKKNKFISIILKKNFWKLVLSNLIYTIKASPMWVLPLITANIINVVALRPEDAVLRIMTYVVLMVILLAQNMPMHLLYSKISNNLIRDVSANIKCALIRKLQSLSLTYHKDLRSGAIQAKFLRDTENIEVYLRTIIWTIIPTVIGIVIATIMAIFRSGIVSLFFLVIIPVNIVFMSAFRGRIKKSNKEYRIKTENMSAKMTSFMEMMPVAKSHGLEDQERQVFDQCVREMTQSGLYVDKTLAYFGTWSWIINSALSFLCLIFCSILSLNGLLPVGDIVLYTSLFATISTYVTAIINVVPQIGAGKEAVRSMSEIMNSKEVESNTGKIVKSNIDGKIEFRNVTYRYPNCTQNVITDLSFVAEKGECIAVVGASGSGKTTIMNMIIGFFFPIEGDILIDDKSITEYDLHEYRHHISVVPQNSILFAGTIRENITYGLKTYSEEELNRAIELANVYEFVKDLPQGLDTNIGEHGAMLSGGQKQRITIARALIRNPEILILDEATSALDNISEYHVQKAISSCIKGRTTFIVAHRLSTIREADRILVMEQGKCVEMGTFEELMKKKGKFYELKRLNEINLREAEEGLK